MTPRINLLPGHIVALRDLRHRRAAHAHSAHDRQLLVIAPIPPPLDPQNFAPHDPSAHKIRRLRRRYARVLGYQANTRQAVTTGRLLSLAARVMIAQVRSSFQTDIRPANHRLSSLPALLKKCGCLGLRSPVHS